MLNVDALQRLRDEVFFRRCAVQRLLTWYEPLNKSCRAMGYLSSFIHHSYPATSEDEFLDELSWLCSLSKDRREAIKARKESLEAWYNQLTDVLLETHNNILICNAWSVFASILGKRLHAEELIKTIWNLVLEDRPSFNVYGLRQWCDSMTDHVPEFPTSPPCSYYYERRDWWKMRHKWLNIIRDKCKQHADVGKISQVNDFWITIMDSSWVVLR